MRHGSDSSDLALRIADFKNDPDQLRDVTEFVDQLLQQAKKDAEIKFKEKDKTLFENEEGEIGIKRRLGRAKTFVVRMFDALCNCTQTAAAAARTTARTNNPFTKR